MSHGTGYNILIYSFLMYTGAQCLPCGKPDGIKMSYVGLGCFFTEWPADIPENSTTVDLSQNNIENITLTQPNNSISVLFLNQNLLSEFPLLSACAETLEWLGLNKNQISYINASWLDMLTGLRALYLNYNYLTTIPDVSGPGNTLYILRLGGNTEFIYTKLLNLGNNLQYLYLAYIPNIMINHDDLGTLTRLVYLDMAFQNMSYFPNLTMIGGHLNTLVISGNTFTAIPEQLLSPLINLRRLTVEFGKFDSIEDLHPVVDQLEFVVYSKFPHLAMYQDLLYLLKNMNQTSKEIDVKETGLTKVPHEICDYKLPSKLDIRANPMICDCRIRWLKMAELSGTELRYSSNICLGPMVMYGRDWGSIGIEELSCIGNIQLFKVMKMAHTFFCSGARFNETVIGKMSRLKCAYLCLSAGTCSIFRYTSGRVCTVFVHGTSVAISNTLDLYKVVQT